MILGIELEELFSKGYCPKPNFISGIQLKKDEYKMLNAILEHYNLNYNKVQKGINLNTNVDEFDNVFIWWDNKTIEKKTKITNGTKIKDILDLLESMDLIRVDTRASNNPKFNKPPKIVYVDWWGAWLEYYRENLKSRDDKQADSILRASKVTIDSINDYFDDE